MRLTRLGLVSAAAIAAATVAQAASPALAVISDIDLSRPFATCSAWRFSAAQEPRIDDPVRLDGERVPGNIDLCLRKSASGPCEPEVRGTLRAASQDDPFNEAHHLNRAQVVLPRGASGGQPLLLVQTASLYSGDGDQAVLTQVLAYRPRLDRFVRVYEHLAGTNNNQEVRYLDAGPLKGDIISVEPTGDAPFGFWVSVNVLMPGTLYQQVLRYRSATEYGDGNPLAVIDSEMPNIERRLGLWRPGSPLPLPAGLCPRPHLTRLELWCG